MRLLENVSWKNPPAKFNESYQSTNIEHLFNILTHGVCILPAVYATWALVHKSTSPNQFWASLIYGIALIMLFIISTAFHSACYLCNAKNRLRTGLHRGDRAMIYIFIASSYFPWLSLMQDTVATVEANLASWLSDGFYQTDCWIDLKWTIWCLAGAGIVYQQIFYERYKWLETIIYVLISVLPSIPFILEADFEGKWELKVGGACYIVGVIFFKCDGFVPLAHAIWHLHVAVGASFHYYAVFTYLVGPKSNFKNL